MSDSFWTENEFGLPSGEQKKPEVKFLYDRPENLFLIHRTSRGRYIDPDRLGDYEQPCKGAFLVSVERTFVNTSTCDREIQWAIYCDNVAKLVESVKQDVIACYGSIINSEFPELEIYDDYRE